MKIFSLTEMLRRVFFYIFISVIMPATLAFIFTLKYDITQREPLSYNEFIDQFLFGASIFLMFFSIWSFFSLFIYDVIVVHNFYKRRIISKKMKLLIQFIIGLITSVTMLSMDKNWISSSMGDSGWSAYLKYGLFIILYSLVVLFFHYLVIEKRFEAKQNRQNIG
jgi:hypothetical protein